ncbi:MAG: hypothetical protein EP319_07765 [Deltaproteobacteria bacterium]|nr:MAG: hypothetical protein EP319_07765 [Deltaproteobacteria bacterium]
MFILAIIYLLFLNLILLPLIHNYYGRYFDSVKLSSREFFILFSATILQSMILFYTVKSIEGIYYAQIMFAVTGVLLLDMKWQIIPDFFNLAGFLAVVGLFLDEESKWLGLTNFIYCLIPLFILLTTSLYEKLTGKNGLGRGDIKLLLWLVPLVGILGLKAILLSLFLAIPKAITVTRSNDKDVPFAFGPYLIAGFFLTNTFFHFSQSW